MTFLLLAVALPGLYWDAGPETAPALREAGLTSITVPSSRAAEWTGVDGIHAEVADLTGALKLTPPKVNYRIDRAAATSSPWLDSNGWKFLRRPQARFYYDVSGPQAALAAAESFYWNSAPLIKTDTAGLAPLAQMLAFLSKLDSPPLDAVADFAFIDDGSVLCGEVMNLLIRDNLLFRAVKKHDRALKLNIRLGDPKFPAEVAKNPGAMAHLIRAELTDEARSLRIYGSQVVVGRLTSASGRLRVQLINYDGAARRVHGVRVRVTGQYPQSKVAAAGSPGIELLDYTILPGATEFTLPELKTYAVIDLFR